MSVIKNERLINGVLYEFECCETCEDLLYVSDDGIINELYDKGNFNNCDVCGIDICLNCDDCYDNDDYYSLCSSCAHQLEMDKEDD